MSIDKRSKNTTVVLLHGLWMTGVELGLLRTRLVDAGFRCARFRYPSLAATPQANAQALQHWLETLRADEVHFVVHSLGGLVLNHFFAAQAQVRPGRIVYLGTPLQPSATAACFNARALTRFLLGQSVEAGLLGGHPGVPAGRQSGMIAGTRGVGIGMLLGSHLAVPNDGTVAVAETRSADLTDRIELPCSHMGMLLSRQVASQVTAFLRHGRFDKAA